MSTTAGLACESGTESDEKNKPNNDESVQQLVVALEEQQGGQEEEVRSCYFSTTNIEEGHSQNNHDDHGENRNDGPASSLMALITSDDDDEINTMNKHKNTSSPSAIPISYKHHISQILSLTFPIIASEIFQNTLPVIDIAFVGNLTKEDLGAAALATVWFNLWNATMLGFMTAIDTILAQSFGAAEYQSFAMWTGNSVYIVIMASIIVSGLIALCEPCMVLFGQDETLAKMAGEFSYRLIPGLIPYYLFKVFTKYLQTQNRVAPGVYIGLIANGINVLANWLFIYKFGMGIRGAPWATSFTRFAEVLLILCYIYGWKKSELSTTPSASASTASISMMPTFHMKDLQFRIIKPFLKLAISGALSFTCEAWSFEITTILAGLLGTIALDAHVITLSIATFIYLSFPFAVGIATSIRVGQLIGEGSIEDAKRSCVVAYTINFILQTALIAILLPFPCSRFLGNLFSSDEEVSALVAKLIPLSCIFMMGDAIQANTGGVMRGLGRQKLVLLLNILGFWLLAVPIGAVLVFVVDGIGVAGLWWGFTIGIYSAAVIGIYFLKSRINWMLEGEKAKKRVRTTHND